MSRLLRLFVFAASFSVLHPAFAGENHDHDDGNRGHNDDRGEHGHATPVPELSGNGAAAAFALIAGGTAIALGRRRSRRK